MSKIVSLPHFSKTMNNLCKLTLLTDSFRQLDQKQSVNSFVLLFEVHITFGFQSEVPPLLFILIDSNIFSNVPLALLVLEQFPRAGDHLNLMLYLTFLSTIAGNLILFSSVTNLIVAQ